MLHGVNRHDNDHLKSARGWHGSALKRSAVTMKQHNINSRAYRHYPNDPALL
ncbi:glycoside hydrolase family 2 TIM barrel-domain containing protein [Enterobacter sp. RHBSTW-01064]|uniref:glycoside hydrolase family 2 TIM barrel-domain containing protein n=1 Tax=Enterobacter sp. RHBSTW-01064 TaxID=2742679 RepID=UPI0023DE1783|nr:glycoside hydrolase family 2 TIM barrel-domain containing protein [Enterobacter sp. RHBSTW-01064]